MELIDKILEFIGIRRHGRSRGKGAGNGNMLERVNDTVSISAEARRLSVCCADGLSAAKKEPSTKRN